MRWRLTEERSQLGSSKANRFRWVDWTVDTSCNPTADLTKYLPAGPNSDSEKQKRRRKKSNKNSKPALTIGLPTFVNGLQVLKSICGLEQRRQKMRNLFFLFPKVVKRSDVQGIPSRQRTNSMSSSNSGSSSWGSSGGSPSNSPPGSDNKLPPRQISMRDRSR